MPFQGFDFSLLRDPDFKEDAVREELVSPLLRSLGYSAAPPNRIVRSKGLVHPFVHIGTRRAEIRIIPDYLMEVEGKYAWALDAKAPRENIKSGSNVEQAFSYAIHPDVRVFLYALCNGSELVIFEIGRIRPVLVVPLREYNTYRETVNLLLNPLAFINPVKLRMKPDYGLYWLKVGVPQDTIHHFYGIGLTSIIKVSDSLYTASLEINSDGVWYAISFDFNPAKYRELLKIVDPGFSKVIDDALASQPFKIDLDLNPIVLNISAKLGEVYQNNNEEYCPFIVQRFQAS